MVVSMYRRISRKRRLVKFQPFSRGTGYTALVDLCGPVSFQLIMPGPSRFREDAAPAELPLQRHGIVHDQPIARAEVDEKSATLSAAQKKRKNILESFSGRTEQTLHY